MHTPAPPPRSSADWTSHTPHSTIRHIPRHIGTQSDFGGYLYSLTTLTVNVYRQIPHFCQQRSSRDQPSCKRCHFHSRHDESVEKYNTILGKQIHTQILLNNKQFYRAKMPNMPKAISCMTKYFLLASFQKVRRAGNGTNSTW